MVSYAQHVAPLVTPQGARARSDQQQNSAGGYAFVLDEWARLDRWLILGCDGGTYYASERDLTVDGARALQACLAADGARTVARIVEISTSGRAPKNAPAIFALAMAAGIPAIETRRAALAALPAVCRTGTDLFHFARDVHGFRRWGRGLRDAVGRWYNDKAVDQLAYQAVKYQQRDGWSHRDLLRLAHPKAPSSSHDALYRWIVGGLDGLAESSDRREAIDPSELPALVRGFEALRSTRDRGELCALIRAHSFTHEMLLSEWKGHPDVWAALLEDMPLTAMLRSLGKMSAVGLLAPMSDAAKTVASRLADPVRMRRARIHPIALLSALTVYQQGHGERAQQRANALSWAPVPQIVDALNEAFYAAFSGVEPTGKKHLLALDVSGSMGCGTIAGVPGLTPRVASAAMAMATAKLERDHAVTAFTTGLTPLAISPRQRLDDVLETVSGLSFGGTDCSLPMIWALKNKVEVDTFVVYTDSETWAGTIQPFQALREYRSKMGRPAKLVVVGMTATGFTIADPSDAGMLDVVGFDAAAPQIMADFARSQPPDAT